VINFPVARAAILVFRGRTYLRREPYVIRHLDVTWTSGSIPQWIAVPAFRRSVNRLMDVRLLDAISHERSDTGSTRRKQYVRWFGRLFGEKRERTRGVAICVGALHGVEMVLVGRKLAGDFTDRSLRHSIRHSRSFRDRVGYDFFVSCWTN
jgi:hypothetical protein